MLKVIEKLFLVFYNLLVITPSIIRYLVLIFVPKRWRAKDVANEIVLVTGAANGIGRLLAIDFARRGAIVIVCDVNQSGNEETAKMINQSDGVAHSYVCDVSDRKSVYDMAKKVIMEVGKVSILVNNAGILVGANFLDLPDEKIQKTFNVNAMGPMWMCKAFLGDMLQDNRGHIVNVCSAAGSVGSPRLSDYCASKHALAGFDESLKMELHLRGSLVHTTLVCPFFFNSGLYKGFQETRFMTEMSTEYVAEEIMAAILANEEKIFIPGTHTALILLKNLLPVESAIKFLHGVGISSGMTSFTGARTDLHQK